MNPCRSLAALLALVALVALAMPATAQDKLIAYRTTKLDVRSDADRETVQAIAAHLDHTLDGYRQELGVGSRAGSARPMMYLFADEQGYHRHLSSVGLNGRGSGGMYYSMPAGTALAIPLGETPRTRTLQVVQHEGFHQFAHAAFGAGLPTWLNEGLAEYFADALVRGGRFTAGLAPATRLDHLRQAQQQDKLISLAELTRLDGQAWSVALRKGDARTQYEQAWSVVYFLRHGDGDATRRRFDRLLAMMAQGSSYDDALRAAFGSSGLDTYEQRWLNVIGSSLEPDAFSTTRDRVLFAAEALRWLHANHPELMPKTYKDLGELLKRANYSTTSTSHGVSVVRRADDPRYFPGPEASRLMPRPANLELVRLGSADLPPSVSAVGVWPRIRLTWSRDKQGRLIDHLNYE